MHDLPVLMEIAERVSALPPGKHPGTHSLKKIFAASAAYYGIDSVLVLSRVRDSIVVEVRHVFCYLAKNLSGHTLPEIGRFMDGRDHTTILNGIQRITEKLSHDIILKDDIECITNILNNNFPDRNQLSFELIMRDATPLNAILKDISERVLRGQKFHPNVPMSSVAELRALLEEWQKAPLYRPLARKFAVSEHTIRRRISAIKTAGVDLARPARTYYNSSPHGTNHSGDICETIIRMNKAGHSNRYVAKVLSISWHTVERILSRTFVPANKILMMKPDSLTYEQAVFAHLIDLKRANHSPMRTELNIPHGTPDFIPVHRGIVSGCSSTASWD